MTAGGMGAAFLAIVELRGRPEMAEFALDEQLNLCA